ncbi:MAG: hypothetical protein STHCBS139747_004451 [Sporothrix thermara]
MVNYEPHAPSATLQYSARLSAKPIHKDALRALAAVYFGKMHRDTRIFDMGVRAYVRSLQRMRTALASPVAVLELETLVSVLCLGLYENVASSDTAGWLNHYEGVSHLAKEAAQRHLVALADSAAALAAGGRPFLLHLLPGDPGAQEAFLQRAAELGEDMVALRAELSDGLGP